MKSIYITNTNPFFNLALEEYYFDSFEEEFLMLYRNEPSVVCGRNQNLFSEINYSFCLEKDIKILRRVSGGGCVFHDLGNINVSLILHQHTIDTLRVSQRIAEVLNNLGWQVQITERGDLMLDGKKISGNAKYLRKNRLLYHCTLLYNSDLYLLTKSIAKQNEKYFSRSIPSVRSEVANLISTQNHYGGCEKFMALFYEKLKFDFSFVEEYHVMPEDRYKINDLAQSKYSSVEWIYDSSSDYTFKNTFPYQNLIFEVSFWVKSGKIQNASVASFPQNFALTEMIKNALNNCRHEYHSLFDSVKKKLDLPIELTKNLF